MKFPYHILRYIAGVIMLCQRARIMILKQECSLFTPLLRIKELLIFDLIFILEGSRSYSSMLGALLSTVLSNIKGMSSFEAS